MFLLDHGNAIWSTEQRNTIRHLTSPATWQAWTWVARGASRRRTSISGMGKRINAPLTCEAAQAWISWTQAYKTREASEDGTRPGWNGLLPAVALSSDELAMSATTQIIE
jgi:hypothetical protein